MSSKLWGVLDGDKAVLIDSLAHKRSTSISTFLEMNGEPHGQKQGGCGLTSEALKAWEKYRAEGYVCVKVNLKYKKVAAL